LLTLSSQRLILSCPAGAPAIESDVDRHGDMFIFKFFDP
jgi:hypothetical protein